MTVKVKYVKEINKPGIKKYEIENKEHAGSTITFVYNRDEKEWWFRPSILQRFGLEELKVIYDISKELNGGIKKL